MPQELFCTINGKLMEQALAPFCSADDSFRLRYGVYETYLYRNGVLEYQEPHWERLIKGLTILGFQIPVHYSISFFAKQIVELVHQNGLNSLARVRLQFFSESIVAPFAPQYLIECFAIEEASCTWLSEGIRIGLLPNFLKKKSLTNNSKISHNAHFLLAQNMMQEGAFDDLLLQNEECKIIESAIANLFWVKDKTIFTTPLSDGCVAGTMRQLILNLLSENAIPFEERSVSYVELLSADEIFLTNSIRKIRWVREFDGRVFGSEMAKKIYDILGIKA